MSVYVLSAGRPQNVEAMRELLAGVDHYWIIPEVDDAAYATAGVPDTRIVWDQGRGISAARNLAISHATHHTTDEYCIQISDDLTRVQHLVAGRAETYTLPAAINELELALTSTGYSYAGCSPTANAFYARDRIHRKAFIVGDLIAIRLEPNERDPLAPDDHTLRFDEALPLKEDYDYTLQHYLAKGGVARCDWLLPSFRHRTNPGGAVAYRTATLEQAAITRLKEKWPGFVRDNPKRPNEILLRFPA